MHCFLGVDGGGSKCDAVLLDERGTVLEWGTGQAGVHGYEPPEVEAESYAQALSGALGELRPDPLAVGCVTGAIAVSAWLEAQGLTAT